MPGLNPSAQDIQQFRDITGADQAEATHFLENGTTLQGAIEDFFAAHDAAGTASHRGLEDQDEDNLDDDDEAELDDALMADQDQGQTPATGGSGAATPGGPGGARTLGGATADTSLPEGWGRKEKKVGRVGEWSSGGSSRRPGEIATLGNTGGAPSRPMPGGFGGGDDDDSDDDDMRRGEKELYAGGEKSGLAVENPDQGQGGSRGGPRGIVEQILKQAADATKPREEAAPRSGFFGGSGNTLGSDETPSTTVGTGSQAASSSAGTASAGGAAGLLGSLLGGLTGSRGAPAPPAEDEEEEVATRSLIFWRNGFSIEDGPLMAYDAPGNPELLRAIQGGRAPPSLFGVRYNQPLQVEVQQRTGEEYVQQKKKRGTWEGEGNRLGSPAPEVRSSGTGTPQPQGILEGGSGREGTSSSVPVNQGGSTGSAPKFEVDTSKPTTNIQVRLADGSKLVAKVNLTHTVRDLRNFISASRPDSRAFVLQTTFPSKELTDDGATVEAAGLKNAVVVQRYT